MKVEFPLMTKSSGPSDALAYHPAPIKLHLFGTFGVEINSRSFTRFYSNKVRALFAYLMLEGMQPVHREKLAEVFWAGYQRQSARTNLRRALTELRKLSAPFKLLKANYQTVGLEHIGTTIVCDVVEFRLLLAECRTLQLNKEVEPQLVDKAQRANLLYNKDFMPGFDRLDSAPFHEWHAEQSAQLADDYQWLQNWLGQPKE